MPYLVCTLCLLFSISWFLSRFFFFFFNDTATTEIYTLSLHDALPIFKLLFLPLLLYHFERSKRSSWVFAAFLRSEEHTSELQSRRDLVCRLLLEKKKKKNTHDKHTRRPIPSLIHPLPLFVPLTTQPHT